MVPRASGPGRDDEEALDQRRGQQSHRGEHRGLRDARRALQEVFEKEHARHLREAGFLEEGVRRQDRGDVASFDRRGHRVAAGGEVQVDRDLAGERRRDVGEGAADRRRQQESDRRLAGCVATDGAREQKAADQRSAKGQLPAGRIGHAERRPLPLGRAKKARSQRIAVDRRGHRVRFYPPPLASIRASFGAASPRTHPDLPVPRDPTYPTHATDLPDLPDPRDPPDPTRPTRPTRPHPTHPTYRHQCVFQPARCSSRSWSAAPVSAISRDGHRRASTMAPS